MSLPEKRCLQHLPSLNFRLKYSCLASENESTSADFFLKSNDQILPYTYEGFVYSVVFVPDSNNVAGCGDDQVTMLWNVQNG